MNTTINTTSHMTTRELKELAMSMFPGSLWATYPDGYMSLLIEKSYLEVTEKLNEFAKLIASRIIVDDEMIREATIVDYEMIRTLEAADKCDPKHLMLFNLYFDVTDNDGRSLRPVWDIHDNRAIFHCWYID